MERQRNRRGLRRHWLNSYPVQRPTGNRQRHRILAGNTVCRYERHNHQHLRRHSDLCYAVCWRNGAERGRLRWHDRLELLWWPGHGYGHHHYGRYAGCGERRHRGHNAQRLRVWQRHKHHDRIDNDPQHGHYWSGDNVNTSGQQRGNHWRGY